MRLIDADPAGPVAAGLLRRYFSERVAGFPEPRGYATPQVDAARFVPPGAFLLAEDDGGLPLGCAGMRPLPGSRMEVKHLFVAPEGRGRGLGRALIGELERRARAAGAAELVLDTNRSLVAAAGLYAAAGFEPIAAYNDNPNATDWFAKRL